MTLTAKQEKALAVWQRWYSDKLGLINKQLDKGKAVEGYSGAEDDLFEAFGCVRPDEEKSKEKQELLEEVYERADTIHTGNRDEDIGKAVHELVLKYR